MSMYGGLSFFLKQKIEYDTFFNNLEAFEIRGYKCYFRPDSSHMINDIRVSKWLIYINDKDYIVDFMMDGFVSNFTRFITIYKFGHDSREFFDSLYLNKKILIAILDKFDCIEYVLKNKERIEGEYLDDDCILKYLQTNDFNIIKKYVLN